MAARTHVAYVARSLIALAAVMALEVHIGTEDGLQQFFSVGSASGRQLAEASEYVGATRSLNDIWQEDGGPVRLLVAFTLVLTLGSLAAGAGVGGGGLFVPIYWLILEAGPKGAVPLSKATILGGAVGNFLSLGWQRHPKTNRPMIDYEASTYMQGGELLGVIFGVLLNKLLPSIVIIVFLILILGWNAYRTIKKGRAIRAKETKAFAAAAAKKANVQAEVNEDVKKTPATQERVTPPSSQNGDVAAISTTADEAQPADGSEAAATAQIEVEVSSIGSSKPRAPQLGDVRGFGSYMDVSSASTQQKGAKAEPGIAPVAEGAEGAADAEGGAAKDAPKAVSAELQRILDKEATQFPPWAWALLAAMTIFSAAHGFVSEAIAASSSCEHWQWWLWYITPVPVFIGFMYVTALILGARHREREAAGYTYLEADLQWTNETLKKFPTTALLAGVTAGLLGIGGGMVIGPLFLSIGMEPQVGTSSCAFMILWTAFSGVVAYGADGNLGAELACLCVGIGFVSGQLGQHGVNAVLKKTGRPSYVVFLLGGIIAAATVAMAGGMIAPMVQGDYDADNKVEEGEVLFYLGDDFGCDSGGGGSSNASGSY